MTSPSIQGRPTPKETARALIQEPKAADEYKHTNGSPVGSQPASVPGDLFAISARRFAEFNHTLLSLPDGQVLLSSPVFGGFARVLPDLRAARLLLKQWEGQ